MERIDGNKVGAWDALFTIITGFDEEARARKFFAYAEDEKFISLEDCKKLIGFEKGVITVIIEQTFEGTIYTYGNHHDEKGEEFWEIVGSTIGYA